MFSSFSISHTAPTVRAEARQQLAVVLSISFLPLVVGFIAVATASASSLPAAVWRSFSSVFLHGELYFYAMSTCAYIFFLSSFTEQRGIRNVRLWSGLFVIFCVAFMALYIGQGQTRSIAPHGLLSIVFLALAVGINYRVIVLSQQPPPMPEDVHRGQADAMVDRMDVDYD